MPAEDRRRELTPEYKKAYNRGWRTSINAGSGTPLDNADARGEPDAWYDGYFDAGTGRAKWHLPNCAAHGARSEGGCGEA